MFKRYLTTHKSDGSFDFISNIIEIEKYDFRNKASLENLLIAGSNNLASGDIDALALMCHEATHFLDLTATTWGLEYIYRKSLFSDKLKNNLSYDDSLKVFMLNTSEIQMHSELVKVFDDDGISINNCTLNHSVIYSQKYGSIIIINFNHAGKIVRSVPLSMLSVMEANAYASEILLKIKIIENNKDENSSVSLKILEREFLEFINETDLSEYNLLLCLCEIHYNYLSLKHRMIFLQSIIRFVLNLGAMNLSIISSFLKETFKDKRLGNAICMDLQRGASRHIVVFKLLLLIYQFINESDTDKKENLQSKIETNPYHLIKKALVHYNIKIHDFLDYGELSEFNLALKWIDSSQHMFDKKIILYSSEFNRTLLKGKTFFDLELNNFKLLDYVLSDETIITVPTRIPIDVMEYFNDNLEVFGKLEGVFRKNETSKFHVHPDDVAFNNL